MTEKKRVERTLSKNGMVCYTAIYGLKNIP